MPKKTERTNPRIEITCEEGIFIASKTHQDKLNELKDMMKQIIRYIDGIDSRGNNIDVCDDTVHICEFCGAKWTETSNTFNGGCCDKDMEYETC